MDSSPQTLDVEQLIAEVFSRPVIWDKRLKPKASRQVVEMCWGEISNELNNHNLHQLKRKWKYLRDQFCYELSKLHYFEKRRAVGDKSIGEPIRSKWRYYDQLHFLKGIIKPREHHLYSSTSSMRSSKNRYTEEDGEEESEEGEDQETDDQGSTFGVETNTAVNESISGSTHQGVGNSNPSLNSRAGIEIVGRTTQKRKLHRENEPTSGPSDADDLGDTQRNLLKIEERALQFLMDNSAMQSIENNDDDLMFLRSLLPYMKAVSGHKKLVMRRRLMEVVDEVLYNTNTSSNGSV